VNATETRIAVLADIHFDPHPTVEGRHGDIGDQLLATAIEQLNSTVRPDVTVLLGDLLDAGRSPGGADRLTVLHQVLQALDSPTIIIPGNHDTDVDTFYTVFGRPAPMTDLCGVRFMPFVDPPAPDFNARRAPADIALMRQARSDGFSGPIVSLQHVPLFPEGACDSPYLYENATETIDAMRDAGISLSISAHYHKGVELVCREDMYFAVAPALCEKPFSYIDLLLTEDTVSQTLHLVPTST
jgi:hypothetical protein